MNNTSLTSEAAYISSYVRQYILIQGSIQARVHSIFSNGFNLICNHSLLFIGKDKESLSAIGLAINAEDLKLIQSVLSVGDPVKISPFFSESEEKISLTFTCYIRPLVTTVIFPSIRNVDLSIPHVSIDQLNNSSLLHRLEEAEVWTQSGFASSQLTQLYGDFVSAFSTGNHLEEAVMALIGAGPGLTPTGDDFLQGMILLEHITSSGTFLNDLVQRQLQYRSTTDVSLAYYQSLFDGYANAQWMKLCTAIVSDNERQLIEAINKIQAYGATSGNDSLVGALTFLRQQDKWRQLWEKEF